jgi:hypothetical protein
MSVTFYMKIYSVEIFCVESIEICESLDTNVYNLVDMFQHVSGIFRFYLIYRVSQEFGAILQERTESSL